jgi:hypothetical protein
LAIHNNSWNYFCFFSTQCLDVGLFLIENLSLCLMLYSSKKKKLCRFFYYHIFSFSFNKVNSTSALVWFSTSVKQTVTVLALSIFRELEIIYHFKISSTIVAITKRIWKCQRLTLAPHISCQHYTSILFPAFKMFVWIPNHFNLCSSSRLPFSQRNLFLYRNSHGSVKCELILMSFSFLANSFYNVRELWQIKNFKMILLLFYFK